LQAKLATDHILRSGFAYHWKRI